MFATPIVLVRVESKDIVTAGKGKNLGISEKGSMCPPIVTSPKEVTCLDVLDDIVTRRELRLCCHGKYD